MQVLQQRRGESLAGQAAALGLVEVPVSLRTAGMTRHRRAARSDGLGSGGALSRSRAGRLGWLLAHPDLWREAPSDSQDVTDAGRALLLALGQQMVDVGLYSPQTEVADRSWGIRVLVGEARRRLSP